MSCWLVFWRPHCRAMSELCSYSAALYLRLSREDEGALQSESITNQRDFLYGYCAEHGITEPALYIDDGFSGTGFVRPGFIRMLEDIESGKINLVLTKDLSRLGRDYILTGHYIERYFPEHGVRYIAVNDQIDTGGEQSGNDMTPFRAVFNDMYARDISKKVRTALDVKKRMGKFIGSKPPYGYRRDPADHNHLLVDEQQATQVRRMFDMILKGVGAAGVARQLNEEKIPPPSAVNPYSITAETSAIGWSDTMVRRIITGFTYIGNLTQNRRKKINYKVDKVVSLPKNEWIISPNTHEGIVSDKIFTRAQAALQTRAYSRQDKATRLFTGLVFCADCGAPMYRISESATRHYLVCGAWKKAGKSCGCSSHCIREERVISALTIALREAVRQGVSADDLESRLCPLLKARPRSEKTLESRLSQSERALTALYLDRADGAVSPEEFSMLHRELSARREDLNRQVSLQNDRAMAASAETQTPAQAVASLLELRELNRQILLALVERISISAEKKITVFLRFGGS